MSNKEILEILKSKISSLGWKMFIWGLGITQEEYWERIYQQEKRFKQQSNKETIEEAAERYSQGWGEVNAFIAGAECQAERMYSEEEVRRLLLTQRGNSYVAILTKTRDKELAAIASEAPEPGGKDGWIKKQNNEQ